MEFRKQQLNERHLERYAIKRNQVQNDIIPSRKTDFCYTKQKKPCFLWLAITFKIQTMWNKRFINIQQTKNFLSFLLPKF